MVYDSKGTGGPTIGVFNTNGTFRRALGRVGGGPGEYRATRVSTCLTAQNDGTILFLDTGNSRIDRWNVKGEPLSPIRLTQLPLGPEPNLLPGLNGSVYVRALLARPRPGFGPWTTDFSAYGYLHVDSNGSIVDTVRAQRSWRQYTIPREFDPWDITQPLPDGTILVSGTDRLAFLLRSRSGGAGTLVEHPLDAIPVTAEEQKEVTAIRQWHQGPVAPPPPVFAEHKSAFFAVAFGLDGSIWLERHTTAMRGKAREALPGATNPPSPMQEWFEFPTFAGFRSDGTYLGDVRFPVGHETLQFCGREGLGGCCRRVGPAVLSGVAHPLGG